MTQNNLSEQPCRKFRARLDSYIDSELTTETNLELMEHLERCPGCTEEARERRKVQKRLQTAVREVAVPAGLEGRIRDQLRRQSQPRPKKKLYLMAIAATLALCFGVLRLRGPDPSLLALAFDDHHHCAVLHHPTAHGAADINRLPDPLKDLTPVVQERVPAELPLILAHECRDRGRKFIHLTFGDGHSLLSLVITRRRAGESLGNGVRQAARDGYQLAAFQTSGYFVYTVSDLTPKTNTEILEALSPAVRMFLAGLDA